MNGENDKKISLRVSAILGLPSTEGQPTALNNVWQLRVAGFKEADSRSWRDHIHKAKIGAI
jgi:hypothetical protein